MKKLRKGMWVLIEARDWEGNSSWMTPEQRQEPAPLGCVGGCVDGQDESTLHLSNSFFMDDPTDVRDCTKIPLGCIEAVYEMVIRREPLWRKRSCKANTKSQPTTSDDSPDQLRRP